MVFEFVICNPSKSYPSLTILVPFWFLITSLLFFYLNKQLFLGFLQFEAKFLHHKNDLKYRDIAPLKQFFGRNSSRLSIL